MTEAEVGVGEDKAAAEAALVAALEQVDGYLQLQGEAGTALRAGWLNIARARHAMGLHRVLLPVPITCWPLNQCIAALCCTAPRPSPSECWGRSQSLFLLTALRYLMLATSSCLVQERSYSGDCGTLQNCAHATQRYCHSRVRQDVDTLYPTGFTWGNVGFLEARVDFSPVMTMLRCPSVRQVSSTMYSSTMKARTVVVTHSREAASSPVVHSEGAPDPMAAPESSQAASASVQEPASSSTAADSGTRQRAAATDANAPADSSGIEAGESSSTTQGGKALPALSVATAELSQQLDSMSLSTGDTAAAPSGDLVVDVGDISSCLRMFGGTPSPYLGAAQNEFVQAVRTLARVAAAQRELLSAVTALRQ